MGKANHRTKGRHSKVMRYKLGQEVKVILLGGKGMIVEKKTSGYGTLYNVKTWNNVKGEFDYSWCSDYELTKAPKGILSIGFKTSNQ